MTTQPNDSPTPRSVAPDGDGSTVELFTGLLGDARDLAVAHLDGVRLEMSRELANLGRTARIVATSIAMTSISLLLGAMAVAHALSAFTALPLWASYLVASVGFAIATGVLVQRLRRTRSEDIDLVPEHQLGELADDARRIGQQGKQIVS